MGWIPGPETYKELYILEEILKKYVFSPMNGRKREIRGKYRGMPFKFDMYVLTNNLSIVKVVGFTYIA